MNISLQNIGKKYNRNWIFRNVNYELESGVSLAVLGGNGSGKSTLLQIIAGYILPTEGKCNYQLNGANSYEEHIYKTISIASPYMLLPEEFTMEEMLEFHFSLKPLLNNLQMEEIIRLSGLGDSRKKLIKHFSSGMKQRLKLVLAFFSETSILLLDEPLSNLDSHAINWYKNLIENYTQKRTVIICSNNVQDEYWFCTKKINIEDFKPVLAK
jgi:ABC-type multidrug transport system ATPase subunit